MQKTKKILMISGIVLIVLLVFYLFNLLNTVFPKNIFNRILSGVSVVLTPALIALVILYLIDPFKDTLINKFKMKRVYAVSLTVLIVVLAVVAFVFFIGFFMYQQGVLVYEAIFNSNFLEQVQAWAAENNLTGIIDKIIEYIQNFDFMVLLSSGGSIFGVIAQTATTIILTPIFLWYFLMEKDKIFGGLLKTLPENLKPHVSYIGKESNILVIAYFKSKIVSMSFLLVVFLVIFASFGLPIGYVFLFALLITILDLVPFLGPTIGMLVPCVYLVANQGTNFFYQESLYVNGIVCALILLGLNTIVQAIQGNIIMPKLAGKEMKINTLLILSSMLFFGNILGVWGVVLSIPLCGIIIVIAKYLKEMYDPVKVEQIEELEKKESN